MPLPLIVPISIAITSVIAGVRKFVKAAQDNSTANDLNQEAGEIVKRAKASLRASRKRTQSALASLGRKKLHVSEGPLKRFGDLCGRFKTIQYEMSSGDGKLERVQFDRIAFIETNEKALSLGKGLLSGTMAGGMAAFGAYGATATLATASTGTAIATLHGVAATNATLAFLGGGTLAAGGLGVAGGVMVLGAFVAAPVLAVAGFVTGANASAKLSKARSNLAEAKRCEAQMAILETTCNAIAKKAWQFEKKIDRLEDVMNPLLDELQTVVTEKTTSVKCLSQDSKRRLASLIAIAQAMAALVNTPLVNQNGALSGKADRLLKSVSKGVAEKWEKVHPTVAFGQKKGLPPADVRCSAEFGRAPFQADAPSATLALSRVVNILRALAEREACRHQLFEADRFKLNWVSRLQGGGWRMGIAFLDENLHLVGGGEVRAGAGWEGDSSLRGRVFAFAKTRRV